MNNGPEDMDNRVEDVDDQVPWGTKCTFDTAQVPNDRPLIKEEQRLCRLVNGDIIRVRRVVGDE